MPCCGDCQHWDSRDAPSHGVCRKIVEPENGDSIHTSSADDRWMLDDGDAESAAEFAVREADRARLAVLSICCCGSLRTRAEFSCILHEPKETVAS